MELAFVLLCVLLGTGTIVYAGLRRDDAAKTVSDAADEAGGEPGEPS